MNDVLIEQIRTNGGKMSHIEVGPIVRIASRSAGNSPMPSPSSNPINTGDKTNTYAE